MIYGLFDCFEVYANFAFACIRNCLKKILKILLFQGLVGNIRLICKCYLSLLVKCAKLNALSRFGECLCSGRSGFFAESPGRAHRIQTTVPVNIVSAAGKADTAGPTSFSESVAFNAPEDASRDRGRRLPRKTA